MAAKRFKIYEIPGVKIGATDRWPQRIKEQGYKEEDCKILFETDILKLASSMEFILQKKHGYKIDTVRYETTYLTSHNRPASKETRAKMSVASKINKVLISSDPIRAASSFKNKSSAMDKSKIKVAQCRTDGTLIKIFESQAEAARKTGINPASISYARKTKTKNTGFLWL